MSVFGTRHQRARGGRRAISTAFRIGVWLRFRIRHALILVNMFTENVKPRKPGRPPGQTAQGTAARERLYAVAMRLIAERGYEATTLRDIAKEAGVSVGLLYRYFPSKQAIVIALYDELSTEYARQSGGHASGQMARPVRLRPEDQPVGARAASLCVARAHAGSGRRSRRGHFCRGDGVLASPRATGLRERRHRVDRRPETAAGRIPRPASVPGPSGRASCGGFWTRVRSAARRRRWSRSPSNCCPLPRSRFACRPFVDSSISADELIREALFENPVAG